MIRVRKYSFTSCEEIEIKQEGDEPVNGSQIDIKDNGNLSPISISTHIIHFILFPTKSSPTIAHKEITQ